MEDRFPELEESVLTYSVDKKNGDRVIKQLLNLVFAKYIDLSVSRISVICLSLRQIIDLLATGKSRYFAQPRSIIIIYFLEQSRHMYDHG